MIYKDRYNCVMLLKCVCSAVSMVMGGTRPAHVAIKMGASMAKRNIIKNISGLFIIGLAFSVAMPPMEGYAEERKKPTLMDLLFKNKKNKTKPAITSASQLAPKKQAKIKKISAPRIYNYKANALKTFKINSIKAAPSNQLALGAFTSGILFSDALKAAQDYALPIEGNIAKAVQAFYSTNQSFIWVDGYHISSEAERVLSVLNDADSYGLEKADYHVDVPHRGFDIEALEARARALMAFEMSLSAKVLRYVQDVEGRRIDPNRLSGYHDLPNKVPELDSVLASFCPKHAG